MSIHTTLIKVLSPQISTQAEAEAITIITDIMDITGIMGIMGMVMGMDIMGGTMAIIPSTETFRLGLEDHLQRIESRLRGTMKVCLHSGEQMGSTDSWKLIFPRYEMK